MEKTFSDALKEHLDSSGKKIAAVAEESNVSQSALYKVKEGKTRNMAVDDAIKVARVFGKTVEEFMGIPEAIVRTDLEKKIRLMKEPERKLLLLAIDAFLEDQAQQEDPADQDG